MQSTAQNQRIHVYRLFMFLFLPCGPPPVRSHLVCLVPSEGSACAVHVPWCQSRRRCLATLRTCPVASAVRDQYQLCCLTESRGNPQQRATRFETCTDVSLFPCYVSDSCYPCTIASKSIDATWRL
jgi:hypothetical protein